jgi:hypothetical protein
MPGVYANVLSYKQWIENRAALVSSVNSHHDEGSNKNTAIGFTSVLFVLSFTTLLSYLIQ